MKFWFYRNDVLFQASLLLLTAMSLHRYKDYKYQIYCFMHYNYGIWSPNIWT